MIEYREAEPVEAKGKAEPIRVWEALEARARFGVDLGDGAGAARRARARARPAPRRVRRARAASASRSS